MEGLRNEWGVFLGIGQATTLAAAIRDRVVKARKTWAILSFPSVLVLNPNLIRAAEEQGNRSLVLYGTGPECLRAFLNRD